MYALESAMDELAVKLGIDPIELRIKNHAEIYPGKNVPFSSKHLLECYQRGAEKFGWAKRNPKPRMTKDGDWWIGPGNGDGPLPRASVWSLREGPTPSGRLRYRIECDA